MAYMKMLGLAVVARAKRVLPTGEEQPANTAHIGKSGRSAAAKKAKRPC